MPCFEKTFPETRRQGYYSCAMQRTALPSRLYYEFVILYALAVVVALATNWQLTQPGFTTPTRWLLICLLTMTLHGWIVWGKLSTNRPNLQSPISPSLGIANTISIVRGVLNSLLVGFLFSPFPQQTPWLPAILWTLSACCDLLDGIAARLTNRQTLLGAHLDLEFDSIATLIVILLTVWYRLMPVWYVLLGLARYLFIIGIWWRKRAGKPIYPMTESVQRRAAAGVQMSFLTVVLWPTTGLPFTTVAAYAFGLPFLLLFWRDWLVVSGRLEPTAASYLRLRAWGRAVAYRWLPWLARGTLLALLAFGYLSIDWSTALGWVLIVTGVMVIGGIIGRIGAILLLIPLVFGSDPLTPRLIMLALTIMVINFGSGPFSLWRPEEIIFEQRLG